MTVFLSKADLFGYSLQPTFKGKSKINTVLGGVVSLLLMGLFTFGFLFTGREIVEKKNPISNISMIGIEDPMISLKEIPIFFSAVSFSGKFLHLDKDFNRSLTLRALLCELGTTENGEFNLSYFNVPVTFCTKDLMGEEYYNIAKKSQEGVDYTLCLDYNNITALDGSKYTKAVPVLKKPFGSQNSVHLNVYFEMCDETKDPGCRKGIESLGSFNIGVTQPQAILNIANNADPIGKSFKSMITTVSSGLTFTQKINFNINELISDEGWILEQNNAQTFYTVDPSIYNATQYSESDRILGRFIFAVNLTKSRITRRYMKLQELVANLGGFIKVSMIIFSFLLNKYSKWTLYNEIIKSETNFVKPNVVTSGTIVNNYSNNSNQKILPSGKKAEVTFSHFLLASLYKSNGKKYKVNWDESVKYLDLVYIRKQFEELNVLGKA